MKIDSVEETYQSFSKSFKARGMPTALQAIIKSAFAAGALSVVDAFDKLSTISVEDEAMSKLDTFVEGVRQMGKDIVSELSIEAKQQVPKRE